MEERGVPRALQHRPHERRHLLSTSAGTGLGRGGVGEQHRPLLGAEAHGRLHDGTLLGRREAGGGGQAEQVDGWLQPGERGQRREQPAGEAVDRVGGVGSRHAHRLPRTHRRAVVRLAARRGGAPPR
ncbi:hypothetical protein [Nocardioides bruguierae]|uniref:Uncharacterized protein n=1 Tax=Nocardioides bruguierae TaxID=2945102 RepID=A0A9X2D4E3_9ACTN|nr:hypothetical protein [Nocardioides bruguierae]MCM0619136.1 hypothetical protein [Nocardioides bruguierae]